MTDDTADSARASGPAPRAALSDAKRIVVKVGSRSLLGAGGRFDAIADEVMALRNDGREVVVISSGAIGVGCRSLSLSSRPKTMDRLQAVAAVGQSGLMRHWEAAFAKHSVVVAQLLLTHADLADRDRYLNARGALDALLELGALPVINENDTVAVEEIRFGDNDQLAAMVATLVGADLLCLLSDVEGVLDGGGQPISFLDDTTDVSKLIRASEDDVGLGGIASKVESARRASRRGVPVIIADARKRDTLRRAVAGEVVGTLVPPHGAKLASRKHWIAYTLKPRGDVFVDDGAARALRSGKSLLPAGVVGVRGGFDAGDAVRIVRIGTDEEIARGLVRYSTREVAQLAGARTTEIEMRIGRSAGEEIVHRDDMIVSS